jgi:hypothetical protein
VVPRSLANLGHLAARMSLISLSDGSKALAKGSID